MKRVRILAIGLLLLLTAVLVTSCTTTGNIIPKGVFSNQQEGIWVTGTGKVTVQPDIATLRLGIEAQEATVAEAQSKATEAMNRVMTALTSAGMDKKDIQTQYFNIQRVTRWDQDKSQEVVIGYRVSNIVTAKIRDISKTGTIIDAVASAGGDLTRIDSIAFSVDDPSKYEDEARTKAMNDAKDKASQLAKLADITLGKPSYISESTYTPGPIYPVRAENMKLGATMETPISPGEMDVVLNVQVVYTILK